MALPRLGQYQAALQHPATAFGDAELRAATVELTPLGLPRVISGGFALTYHLTGGGHEWAVRCFHREAADLERRYDAISRAIGRGGGGPFVPIEYQARGVLVEGRWYPVTRMPWLHAVPLNRYLETNGSAGAAARLAQRFRELVRTLRALRIAHGDLQHGNILVEASGSLKLVDYDGMYVPALRGMQANESGHVNYQHPQRAGQFDGELDRFSALVIYVALEALAARPGLWTTYSNGDNLLFKRADFLDPPGSALFQELATLPTVRPPAERLRALCGAPYGALPALEDFLSGAPASSVATARAAAPPVARVAPAAFAATDRGSLLDREGDIVTVVGQVTGVRRGLTRFGKPYAFLTFGGSRERCFSLLLWSPALELFERKGRDVAGYRGRWVSVTGMVTVYRPRGGGAAQPQITVTMPSEIQLLREERALELLGVWPAQATPTGSPGPGRLTAPAAVLNRLYGGHTAVPSSLPAPAYLAAVPSTPTPSIPRRPPRSRKRPSAPACRGRAAPNARALERWRNAGLRYGHGAGALIERHGRRLMVGGVAAGILLIALLSGGTPQVTLAALVLGFVAGALGWLAGG